MNVVLLNPPRYPHAGRRLPVGRVQRCESVDQTQCLPPIDFLAAAPLLRAQGHTVTVVDANGEDLTYGALRHRLEGIPFDLLVQKAALHVAAFDLQAAALAKELRPGCVTLARSVAALGVEERFLEAHPALDGFLFGEPEAVVPRVAAALDGGGRLEDVPGLSLRGGRTSAGPLYVEDLDALPLPDLAAVDLHWYWSGGPERRPLWLVWSSRGCPFRCRFCVIGGNRFPVPYRRRSATRVADELEALADRGGDKFGMFDETFLLSPHAEEVCREILGRGLEKRLWWYCNGKLDAVTEELVELAARAGCRDISFGVETADARLLDAAGKRSRIDRVREVWSWQERYGVAFFASFVVGLPGEDAASVALTKRLIRELGIQSAFFSLFTPYPCTVAYPEAAASPWLEERDFEAFDQFSPRAPVMRTEAFSRQELREIQQEYYRLLFRNRVRGYLKGFVRHPGRHLRELPRALRAGWRHLALYGDPTFVR
ncbi:MAG: hypothetical protein Kow0092_03560 [Deferrisomatales bacterium]